MDKSVLITADSVIIEKSKILLIKRAVEPFKGFWVLPGGKLEFNERIEDCVVRETLEEVGIRVNVEGFLGYYDGPGRDPRGSYITLAFFCRIIEGIPKTTPEASEVGFFSFSEIDKLEIGFDHRKIIKDAIKK